MNIKANILQAIGVLTLIVVVLFNITRNLLVQNTSIVILVFTVLLFKIDPLKPYTKKK